MPSRPTSFAGHPSMTPPVSAQVSSGHTTRGGGGWCGGSPRRSCPAESFTGAAVTSTVHAKTLHILVCGNDAESDDTEHKHKESCQVLRRHILLAWGDNPPVHVALIKSLCELLTIQRSSMEHLSSKLLWKFCSLRDH